MVEAQMLVHPGDILTLLELDGWTLPPVDRCHLGARLLLAMHPNL